LGPDDIDWTADFVFLDLDPKSSYFKAYQKLSINPGGYLIAHDLTYPHDAETVGRFSSMLKTSQEWVVMEIPQERGLVVAQRME
jgi:predicted O-methyltransferase YrrM